LVQSPGLLMPRYAVHEGTRVNTYQKLNSIQSIVR
jgi:hypothetical protein